jgi:two-component system, NtrC family, C4-dicarboxylate transport sensor histidine kinase DctB
MTRRRLLLQASLGLVVIAALGWLGERWAFSQARSAADAAAAQAAQTHGALLESELQKFRLLPIVLIEYPDVAAALLGDVAATRRLDETLELLAKRTDAADIYVIRPDGVTVAASNARRPTSFVGQNYGFRPYFRNAMRGSAAELFALGTVSRRPGLYLARRVDRRGAPLGVVVVKVEFNAVEAAWARAAGASFATDANGTILVTSIAAWRFRSTGTLKPAIARTGLASENPGLAAPRSIPLTVADGDALVVRGRGEVRFRLASSPVTLAGGKLYHIAPLDGALAAARAQALLLGLGLLFVLASSSAIGLRAAETRRLQRRARIALEAEVARRTTELRKANAQLIVESEQRAAADRRYRAAREELAQASRLGTLGQVTAGVAHEINQPVAAIRTFAENGTKLLARGDLGAAGDNLSRIVELTERIGRITAELRSFARKRSRGVKRETIGPIVDGVMILIGERARGRLQVVIDPEQRLLAISGERVRVEQILVNLIQNALDAVAGQEAGVVTLRLEHSGETIALVVEDNGPGVDPSVRDTLFTPFTTAKPGGLGLGLAIARDIAREFGGELRHQPGTPSGTCFTLTLNAA